MSPSLLPPDPAILLAITRSLHAIVQRSFRWYPEFHARRVYGEVTDETLGALYANQASYLYDALLDWMGPGGDVAFLEMFLLANANFPELNPGFVYKTVDLGNGEEPFFDERSKAVIESLRKYDKGSRKEPATNFTQLTSPPWNAIMLPRLDIIYREESFWCFKQVQIIVYPSSSYREDLMGELASPWPQIDGMQPYYRPRRHVLPLERPYDASGYIP